MNEDKNQELIDLKRKLEAAVEEKNEIEVKILNCLL